MRDELLNCEIFDTMQEARVLIEKWLDLSTRQVRRIAARVKLEENKAIVSIY